MNISVIVRTSLAFVLSLSVPLVSGAALQAPPAAAVFLRADTATQGSWIGSYGSEGSVVIGDSTNLPPYAGFGTAGAFGAVWDPNSPFVQALQRTPPGVGRIAATLFNDPIFSVFLNHTDGLPHQVALYCLDYDSPFRRQDVRVFDANSGALLSTHRVSSFTRGLYLVWNITGAVRIDFAHVPFEGANAVLSGIFWDPPAPPPATIGGLRAAVQALPTLAPSQRTLLIQTLDAAAARAHANQFPQAAALLRSFQSYVTRFSPPLTVAEVTSLNGAAAVLVGGSANLTSGLQGHWKLDGNALDSSPFARHGAFLGFVPPLNPGRIGGAMTFVPGGNGVMTAPMTWPVGSPVSVAFWNFSNGATFGVAQSAFTIGANGGERLQSHAPWYDFNLYFDYGNLALVPSRMYVPYGPYVGRWTHVTLVSSGLNGTWGAVYLDGVPVSFASATHGPTSPLNGAFIGSWPPATHNGSLDDFRIYNRVLSPAEVRMLADQP